MPKTAAATWVLASGMLIATIFILFVTVLTPSQVLHLHHATLLLAVVQVKISVIEVNIPLITPLSDLSTTVT